MDLRRVGALLDMSGKEVMEERRWRGAEAIASKSVLMNIVDLRTGVAD
jgi:hypothetical protein